jgi:hypothetical protein
VEYRGAAASRREFSDNNSDNNCVVAWLLQGYHARVRHPSRCAPFAIIFPGPMRKELAMHFMDVNLLAVLVCGIATMAIGFLWYSPLLFAKPWVREMGYDLNDTAAMEKMKKSAGPAYGASFVGSLVSAAVLGKLLDALSRHGEAVWHPLAQPQPVVYGVLVGLAVWLGFVATVQLTSVLFANQSAKLFAINTGYQLVCYVAMGAILAVWK